MSKEMIIDEILFAERIFKEENRNMPSILTMSDDCYDRLCAELDVDSLETYHGMDVEISDEVEDFELRTLYEEMLDYYDDSEGYFD